MKRTEDKAGEIRKQVSKDYARDVSTPGPKGCCRTDPKGVLAKVAGYSAEEVAALPAEAATNSFGCGNPVALADVKEGQTVLDLGCGAGIDVILAAKRVGPKGKVIGVDMTDEMIAKAKANVKAAGLTNVDVRRGIIEDLPVESSSVDLVISNCVINLSPEKEKVFKEIARVLKQGGGISISDIVAEELPPEIVAHPALYSSCVSGAVSEKKYVQGLQDAGLTDVEVRDRLVYDRSQMEALIGSEVKEADAPTCCGSQAPFSLGKEWAKKLAGKVWSVRVVGRRA
ncbi:MAG: arsenite methyltransferase [Pseudomonadota bacterium]